MPAIDYSKGATTFSGHFPALSYILQCAKEDFITLLKEIDNFKPKEAYPKHDPKVAYHIAFYEKLYKQEVHIVLVASAMIEAMANMLLSMHTDADTFGVLERSNPIEKWVTLPKLFIPSYKLEKDGVLYQNLKLLITRRNSIAHPKPEIAIGDKVVHRGNFPKKENKETKLHLDFCNLPYDLLDNLSKYEDSVSIQIRILFRMLMEQEQQRPPKQN